MWIGAHALRHLAKDPTSPIAVAHEMARKNGTRPGAFNPVFLVWTLLASLVMVAVDARRRPVLAAVAYSMTLFVTPQRRVCTLAGLAAVGA